MLSEVAPGRDEGPDEQCWFQVKPSANLPLRVDWRDSRSDASAYVLRKPSPGISAYPVSAEAGGTSGKVDNDACTTLRLISTDPRLPLRSWSPLRTTFAGR